MRVASFDGEDCDGEPGATESFLGRYSCSLSLTSAVVLRAASVAQGATPGLVAAYSFDEGSGTQVADASGNLERRVDRVGDVDGGEIRWRAVVQRDIGAGDGRRLGVARSDEQG